MQNPRPLSKDQSMSSVYMIYGPSDLFRCVCAVGFFKPVVVINKAPFIYKYKLSQKALSTLNIYKIVIRLKSQVLRKEDSRLVQTDRHATSFFLLKLKALGPLDRRAHHRNYQGGPKSPPHVFFVLTNLDCFDLGTSLKKLCFKRMQLRSLYRSLYLFDRQ